MAKAQDGQKALEEAAKRLGLLEKSWGHVRDMSQEGEGIAAFRSPDKRLDGRVAFVPGLIPGDIIELEEASFHRKRFRVEKYTLIEASPDRQAPFCQHFGQCGGCQLQAMDYQASLRWKTKRVKDSLERLGKFQDQERLEDILLPCFGMEEPWAFRSIVQLRPDTEGRLGFYKARSTEILALDECPIQTPAFNQIREKLNQLIGDLPRSQSDLIQEFELRQSSDNSHFLILGQLEGDLEEEGWEPFISGLTDYMDQALGPDSLSLWLEDSNYLYHAAGEKKLIMREGEIELRFSPHSFQQTNLQQNARLYHEICDTAIQALKQGHRDHQQKRQQDQELDRQLEGERGQEAEDEIEAAGELNILELYSGVGSISIHLAKALPQAQILGVEVNRKAVLDALDNAALNWLPQDRLEFKALDAGAFFSKLVAEDEAKAYDLLVLDPPRQGLSPDLCQDILTSGLKTIIYVSCDPASLARDLGTLKEGYQLVKVQPIDMFPWTTHVETVVLMSRKG